MAEKWARGMSEGAEGSAIKASDAKRDTRARTRKAALLSILSVYGAERRNMTAIQVRHAMTDLNDAYLQG
jgi:hypothetical protein